ncbi:MAG: membrane bound O-acyl transferase family-domain-containing protein [Planctomycetota bacterium]
MRDQPTTIRPESASAMRWAIGLAPLIALPPLTFLLCRGELPAWATMWAVAFVIFLGCKWLTITFHVPRPKELPRLMAYLLGWPGLDLEAFLHGEVRDDDQPTMGEWALAAVKLGIGLVFVYGLARLVPKEQGYWRGWLGMIGIVMTLHFGSFHLLSCFWRSRGVRALPLMNAPLLARSPSEFWGRRWNRAFRDLTHRFLFGPLARPWGASKAAFIGFAFSGVIHDAVISIPAGGGYGGPTLYFLGQALAIRFERSRVWARHVKPRPALAHLLTLAMLALPAPLLFHPPFVHRIILPFLEAIGGLTHAR